MPPFVIFDRKKMNRELMEGEVPNTYYGMSPKGWIDTALFHDWFFHHFLSYAPSCRPLLLLMDGHSSHFCPEMIRMAAEEKVILFILPPHTTQICQPLDKGVFSALKSNWKKVCHDFITKHPGRVITRYDFSALLSEAWDSSMTIKNIKSGFRVTGVYPFNKSAIVLPEESYEKFNPEALSRHSGLSYIPLYSPVKSRKQFQAIPHLGIVNWNRPFLAVMKVILTLLSIKLLPSLCLMSQTLDICCIYPRHLARFQRGFRSHLDVF